MFDELVGLAESLRTLEVDPAKYSSCREARKVLQAIKVEAQKQRREITRLHKEVKGTKAEAAEVTV